MPNKSAKKGGAAKRATRTKKTAAETETSSRPSSAGAPAPEYRQASETQAAVDRFEWPTTSDPIGRGANVVIGFHGLMCFCHTHRDAGKECEVGIHNKAPDHTFTITVFKVSPAFDPPHEMDMTPYELYRGPFDISHTGNSRNDKVRFNVKHPVKAAVEYFQQGAPKEHPNNFRNILDLEGEDFYEAIELGKKSDNLGPRLRIDAGLFYTICKSGAEFRRVASTGGQRDIGGIARMAAANIYLQANGSVTLKMKNAPDVEMSAADGKFFVLVDNGCQLVHPNCEVGDFILYYETFDIPPANAAIFNLVKVGGGPATPAPGSPCALFLPEVDRMLRRQDKLLSTDDSPCGVAGYGSSGSIP